MGDTKTKFEDLGDDEVIMIRVSRSLVKKCVKKMRWHEDMPAVYVVDSVLRIFTEGA